MTKAQASPEFGAWVAARRPALVRFAYLVTADRATAEDAVQEALAKAFKQWPQVYLKENPDAYLRRMIVNTHISWWRRFAKREQLMDAEGIAATTSVEDHSTSHATSLAWNLCASLPPRQRAAIVLRFYEDLSYAEIAEILHVREVTVRTNIHRALAALREKLRQDREYFS